MSGTAAKTMIRRARVLVVGTGRMGRIRASALNANPRFELAGVVDKDADGAMELGDMYRAPPFTSLSAAIHASTSSHLDGIVISTPTPTHEPLISEAAAHGISIFTEKPVDETASQIARLFDACEKSNTHHAFPRTRGPVHLCCGFQRRFDESYRRVAEDVRGGRIGRAMAANVFFGDHPVPTREFLLQGGGNIIADCAAHDVDYVRWALGDEVESVYSTGTSSDDALRDANVIDNATMVMKFTKGTVVTLTLSRGANYGYDQRLEIFGTLGLASVRNQPEHSGEISDASGVHRPKWKHSFPQRFRRAFENEMDAFADTLLLGVPWGVTKEDCVAVQRVCDAALESCESGEVVRLDGFLGGANTGGSVDRVASTEEWRKLRPA